MKINKLNVSFFTPALLFSKVAFTLNPARLAELYIVPIGFVIITCVSAIGAFLLSKIARLSSAQTNFTIACAISPNSNSLPVALMQSLVVTVPQLRWDEAGQPKDTKDGMLGRALTYLVLFSTLGMFLRWSIGVKLLSSVEDANYDEDVEDEGPFNDSARYRDEEPSPRGQLVSFSEDDTDQHANSITGTGEVIQSPVEAVPPPITVRKPTGDHHDGDPAVPSPTGLERRPSPGRINERSRAWTRSFPDSPDEESDRAENEQVEGASSTAAPRPSFLKRFVINPLLAVNRFMTMPLWAAILSLIVALIGPLQKFIDSLEPVVGALKTAGNCSIPLTMVVLGSYFYEDKSAIDALKNQNAGTESGPNTGQTAALEGTGTSNGARSGESTLVGGAGAAGKRRSLPWGRNPWNSSATPSEADSRGSGNLSSSGHLSASAQSENTDDGTSTAASESGPEGGRAQEAWTKVAERNAAKNSRKGFFSSANAQGNGADGNRSAWKVEVKRKRALTMERRTIAVAVASRMLFTPIVLLPTAAWYAVATRYNVMDDPVFIASACLLIGSPPALTLAQITSQSASGNSGFERLISKTIFVSYAIMAAPTTIALVLVALLIAQYDH